MEFVLPHVSASLTALNISVLQEKQTVGCAEKCIRGVKISVVLLVASWLYKCSRLAYNPHTIF